MGGLDRGGGAEGGIGSRPSVCVVVWTGNPLLSAGGGGGRSSRRWQREATVCGAEVCGVV